MDFMTRLPLSWSISTPSSIYFIHTTFCYRTHTYLMLDEIHTSQSTPYEARRLLAGGPE